MILCKLFLSPHIIILITMGLNLYVLHKVLVLKASSFQPPQKVLVLIASLF